MIDFSLAPKPTNYLEPLQAFGLGQQAARQRAADARAEVDRKRADETRATVSTRLGAHDYLGAETAAISGGNAELASHIASLDAATRTRVAEGFNTIGSLAYSLKQVPPEERQARFQAAIPMLRAHGLGDDVLQHVDLSDAGLDGYVSSALTVKEQIAQANAVADRNKPVAVSMEERLVSPVDGREIVGGHPKLSIQTVTNADGTQSIVPVDPYTGQAGGIAARGDAAGGGGGAPPAHGGTVALDGNNPGGINDGAFAKGMPGYQGANGRFAKFATLADGINAQTQLLRSYIRRGINTPIAIASKWAPAGDGNDPASYAAHIAQAMGIGVHDKIGPAQIEAFQRAQANQENHMYGARAAAEAPASSGGAVYTSNAAGADSGMDDNGLNYVADIYRRTGQLPPLGMGKAAAGLRTRIIQRAQQRDAAEGRSGADAVAEHADVKGATASLAQQEKNADAVFAAEATALANGQQFLDRSREMHGQTHYPWLNAIVNSAQRATGGTTVKAMDIARDTFLTEYAKVVAGSPSGAGVLSDSARNNALDLVSGNATFEQKLAAFEQLKRDMHNRVESLRHQQEVIRTRLRGSGGGNVRRITGDADYQALPSGTHFIGPDGVHRVKP
jgi:hypothetical protein